MADDLRALAFYAFAAPGSLPDRWWVTGQRGDLGDSEVDFALRHQAVVLRYGDGVETERP